MWHTRSGARPWSAPTGPGRSAARSRSRPRRSARRAPRPTPAAQPGARTTSPPRWGTGALASHDRLAPAGRQRSTSSPCSSTPTGTGSSPACSAISRCRGHPGSSTRDPLDTAIAQRPADDRKGLREARRRSSVCSGSGAAAAHAPQVAHQLVAQLRRAPRDRRARARRTGPRARPTAASGASRRVGNAARSGSTGAKSRRSAGRASPPAAAGARRRRWPATRVGAPWLAVR